MTSVLRSFLAGITAAAILSSPVIPSGSARQAQPPGGQPVQAAAFSWPVDPPITILRDFAPPPEPWLPGHRGIDLAARPGQRIRSAGAGVVTFAGPIADRGVVVVLLAESAAGHRQLRITYEPVRARVHRGDSVRVGDLVGSLENSTRHCGARGTCLHWGLRQGATYLDPLLLVRPRRIRLLPLDRELAPSSAPWPPRWTFARVPDRGRQGPGPVNRSGPPVPPDPAMAPVVPSRAMWLAAPALPLRPDAFERAARWLAMVEVAVSRTASAVARMTLTALAGQTVSRIRGSPSASRS